MKDTKVERARRSAAMLRRQFLHGGGLFAQVLDELTLATVLDAHGKPSRDRVYPPLDTLRLFIGQVLSADRACQDVVGRRLSERLAHGQPASALNTGSYCDARSRLPLAMPTTLGSLIGERLESAVPLPPRTIRKPGRKAVSRNRGRDSRLRVLACIIKITLQMDVLR